MDDFLSSNWYPFAIILLTITVYPIFWYLFAHLIARMTGWHRLVQRFGIEHDPLGEEFKFRSGRFGRSARYKNVLALTVSFEGIAFYTFVLFRPGHAPFLIPWDALQALTIGKSFTMPMATLVVRAEGDEKVQKICLYETKLVESIRRNAPQNLLLNE